MIRTRETIRRRGLTSIAAVILAALALIATAAWPAGASADVAMQIVERCGRGQSLAGFTVAQYRRALEKMPTEAAEYSDCAERISQAELAAARGHHTNSGGSGLSGPGSGSSSGSASDGTTPAIEPTPAEQHDLEAVRHAGAPPPVHLTGSGKPVLPGVVHPDLASATSDLPTPVLVVIALVLAGLLLLAGLEIRDRITRSSQS